MFATITLAPAIDTTLRLARPMTPGAVHRTLSETRHPGGKGINVAKVLAAHGCDVSAGGLLGADNATLTLFENELFTHLKICDCFVRVPGTTRENMMLHDGASEYKINRPAFPELQCSEALLEEVVARVAESADVVILCGALPALFPSDTYARLVASLKGLGKVVALDSSGDALAQGVSAKPHIIKPNRAECEALLGRALATATPESMVEACRELGRDHEVVILSDGSRGCYFAMDGGETVHFAAVPGGIAAVDTTAAGDMLLAEFCYRYFPCRRLTREVIAHAVAMGAAATERFGSECPELGRVGEIAGEMGGWGRIRN